MIHPPPPPRPLKPPRGVWLCFPLRLRPAIPSATSRGLEWIKRWNVGREKIIAAMRCSNVLEPVGRAPLFPLSASACVAPTSTRLSLDNAFRALASGIERRRGEKREDKEIRA